MKTDKIIPPPACECGSPARLVDSKEIYGRSYGWAWVCERFPVCDSYVGCHPMTRRALGTLANKELRGWRMKAHSAFDAIWRSGGITRKEAYRSLRERMNLSAEQCHISMFSVEQCMRVVDLCQPVRANA